jgi:hypothetical protein
VTAASETMTVLAARERYLRENGFNPAYDERWVKLEAGGIPIWFPNAPGRVRAVKLHDVHHVATDYDTSWTGEAEIAAWELASGCGRFAWAWGLNLAAMPIGLALAPRAVFRAFVRGRHTTNLYRTHGTVDDRLLGESVGTLRAELGLDLPVPPPRVSDAATFAAFAVAGLAPLIVLAALLAIALG